MAALVVFLCSAVGSTVEVGQKVEDFKFVGTDWNEKSVSQLQKQTKSGVLVLTFWCSTCSSCRTMEKKLDALHQEFAGRATVVALASAPGDRLPVVRRVQSKSGLTLPIMLDPRSLAAKRWGVKMTTTTLVLDGDRRIRYFGPFISGEKRLAKEAVAALLAGKKPATTSAPPAG